MATVIITAAIATGARPTTPMILQAGTERATQEITSSASNQVSTVVGKAGETMMIGASGGSVLLAVGIGANPDATSTAHYIVHDNTSFPLFCAFSDTRVAVVDV